MKTIEQRLLKLETANPPTDELTIIRRIVWPGHLDAELDRIRDDTGQEWTRQPGESETTFTERAANETQPNKWGVKSLIATNTELEHASH
jgi:hypothetical protein